MKFVVDAQLPPALTRLLREAGCDAFAVREIGLREANDAEIWRYAVRETGLITNLLRSRYQLIRQFIESETESLRVLERPQT